MTLHLRTLWCYTNALIITIIYYFMFSYAAASDMDIVLMKS